jgi:hypothetical protein
MQRASHSEFPLVLRGILDYAARHFSNMRDTVHRAALRITSSARRARF